MVCGVLGRSQLVSRMKLSVSENWGAGSIENPSPSTTVTELVLVPWYGEDGPSRRIDVLD